MECIPANSPPQRRGRSRWEVLSVVCLTNINCIVCGARARAPSPPPPRSPTGQRSAGALGKSPDLFVSRFVFFVTTLLPQEYLWREKEKYSLFLSPRVSQKTTLDVFNRAGFQHGPGYHLFGWGDIRSHRQCVAQSVHNYLVKASQDVFLCFMVNTSLPV